MIYYADLKVFQSCRMAFILTAVDMLIFTVKLLHPKSIFVLANFGVRTPGTAGFGTSHITSPVQ